MNLSYDGHNFMGFQRQSGNIRTIQGVLENTISRIFNDDITITASGRTDAGVHALKQVVSFECKKEVLDLDKLRYSLNCMLPQDIHINKVMQVNDDFHPRHNVINKTYQYKINMGEANPFYENYRYEFKRKLDLELIKLAVKEFIGEHNFKNFTTKEEDNHEFVRRIDDIFIENKGDVVTFTLIGNGFMRYMVRMIVGTLIMVGLKKEDYLFVRNKLKESPRNVVIYKAPPQGLYLVDVKYKGE